MGRKNRPRTEPRVGEPPKLSKYADKRMRRTERCPHQTEQHQARGTRATVFAVPINKGIVFVRTDAGLELSINMSVVRRDYKSGAPPIGWIVDYDYEANPKWKRPRVTRIHSVTPA